MKVKKKLAISTGSTTSRKKKLAGLPREVRTDRSLVSGKDRMWIVHYDRLERARKQTRDAKKEIRELKKKVSSLNETIVWLLNK